MKNLIVKTFNIFIILTIMVSCSSGHRGKMKVCYLYPSKSKARFVSEGNFMMERLKQLGYEASMIDANNNDAMQLEKGFKILDNVNLLIITPVNGNTIAPLIREANNRGIPVIAYNRLIENCDYSIFVTGNNKDNGRILCDEALKLKPKGNYVILAGDRFDRNGVELKNAIDSILAPHVKDGSINILYESYIESWNKANAENELEQVIESYGTNIDAILSCSDPMGIGAVEVLQKYGLAGKVVVTGQDAILPAVQNIEKGLQQITIYHPHKKLGYETAELADKILKGNNPKKLANSYTFNGKSEIPTLQIKSIAVTKENVGKELVESGEYTWNQINQ